MQTPKRTVRRSSERGHIDHGWLDAKHTFSFGQYSDPRWAGFRGLRVINEDVIGPRMGFGEHPHRDMEIITYPISGAVRHRDSIGHEEDIVPGMIQHMSAGSGIRHSEFNPLDERTHMLQIWIEPREKGVEPRHQSRSFPIHDERNALHLLASHDGAGGSVRIETDARMLAGRFDAGAEAHHALGEFRHAWVQVVRGEVRVSGEALRTGDGIAMQDIDAIGFAFDADTEVVVFELA